MTGKAKRLAPFENGYSHLNLISAYWPGGRLEFSYLRVIFRFSIYLVINIVVDEKIFIDC